MSDSKRPEQAALEAVKSESEQLITLSTGYKARILPVPATVIEAATSRIPDPEVPKWYNEEKAREEPNPNHPAYLAAVEDAMRRRGMAGMDVMIVMGVELVDPIPEDKEWLGKLRQLERLGHLDLSLYDLSDDIDREFVFKKYVAVNQEDYELIARRSGLSAQAVREAEDSFRGD